MPFISILVYYMKKTLSVVPCPFCYVKYTCQGNHFWRSFTYLMVKLVAFGATPNLAASHCVVCLIE